MSWTKKIEQFEVTEADLEDRRRGDEYRNSPNGTVTDDPVENWDARAARIPVELRRVSKKKLEKSYTRTTPTGLLIYLNPQEFGIRHNEIISSFAASTASAKDAFNEVWIYWKGMVYLIWKNGKAIKL